MKENYRRASVIHISTRYPHIQAVHLRFIWGAIMSKGQPSGATPLDRSQAAKGPLLHFVSPWAMQGHCLGVAASDRLGEDLP
jgi:hypothetical protein